jgi:hypothetical protein
MFCRLVSQVLISWWAYVLFRSESLDVKGQELDFVYVIMQIINIIYKHRCVPTNHKERMMGTKLPHNGQGKGR